MPTLSKVTGYIEPRRVAGGYRWVIFIVASKIEQAEVVSNRVFRRRHNAFRSAEVWAKRLGVETE